jgi:hypothetical protein
MDRGAAKLWAITWISGWTNPYLSLVLACHFFETRNFCGTATGKNAKTPVGENEKLRRIPTTCLISDLIVVS